MAASHPRAPVRIWIPPEQDDRIPAEPAALRAAVVAGGAALVDDPSEATGLIWTTWWDRDSLPAVLDEGPDLEWVQLVTAGADDAPLGRSIDWTSAKGAYAAPMAEFVLGSAIAALRSLPSYARARSWLPLPARSLRDGRVTVLGGGGVAAAIVGLLGPFDTEVTVVRRDRTRAVPGAAVVGPADIGPAVADADVVVVALALTPETEGIVGPEVFDRMAPGCVLVNVARGRHVDTDALVRALAEDRLAAAVLDVTDPEPLPREHPLWRDERVLVTPHVACTPSIARPLLLERVAENVRRRVEGVSLLGSIDPGAGY